MQQLNSVKDMEARSKFYPQVYGAEQEVDGQTQTHTEAQES